MIPTSHNASGISLVDGCSPVDTTIQQPEQQQQQHQQQQQQQQQAYQWAQPRTRAQLDPQMPARMPTHQQQLRYPNRLPPMRPPSQRPYPIGSFPVEHPSPLLYHQHHQHHLNPHQRPTSAYPFNDPRVAGPLRHRHWFPASAPMSAEGTPLLAHLPQWTRSHSTFSLNDAAQTPLGGTHSAVPHHPMARHQQPPSPPRSNVYGLEVHCQTPNKAVAEDSAQVWHQAGADSSTDCISGSTGILIDNSSSRGSITATSTPSETASATTTESPMPHWQLSRRSTVMDAAPASRQQPVGKPAGFKRTKRDLSVSWAEELERSRSFETSLLNLDDLEE